MVAAFAYKFECIIEIIEAERRADFLHAGRCHFDAQFLPSLQGLDKLNRVAGKENVIIGS